MTLINHENSAHDLMEKFSPSVSVAVVASLTREVAVQSFASMLIEEILLLSMAMTKH